MHVLQETKREYHLLDLSQHASLTGAILKDFGLQPHITKLATNGRSITTYAQAISWFSKGIWLTIAHKLNLRERFFMDKEGVVLLHGDTLSTLLGFRLAKAAGLRTALVEAGLSSGSLLDPFPEEIIRRYTSRRAAYLFPPDAASETWLRERIPQGLIKNTGYNTVYDSISLILALHPTEKGRHGNDPPYGIATLHRLETLSSRKRLRQAIHHIIAISRKMGLVQFYMHEPTRNALKRSGLINILEAEKNILIKDLAPYPEFILAQKNAEFILTDGGSIQEEAAYLSKPCLILRNRTERNDGVGKNAVISTWVAENDIHNLKRLIGSGEKKQTNTSSLKSSLTILRALREYGE